mmetsp:Transcript_60576/g.189753  ORF Transcript_60576/g.189753 Transcript_60576/m.189753 type:complete len:152 (-) Transcript_60576:782-1237(-)
MRSQRFRRRQKRPRPKRWLKARRAHPKPAANSTSAGKDSMPELASRRPNMRSALSATPAQRSTTSKLGAAIPNTNRGIEHHNSAQEAIDFRRKKSRAAEAGVASTCTKPSSSVWFAPQLLYSMEASSKQSTAAWSPVARRKAPLIIVLATF